MAQKIGYGAAQIFLDPVDPGDMVRQAQTASKQQLASQTKLDKDQATYKPEEFKRWEDEKGFAELTKQEEDLRSVWNQSYQSGYNIKNPRTSADVQLSKKYYESFNKFREASQLYTTQGDRFAGVIDQIDKLKDEDYDKEATMANLERYKGASSVFERAGMIDGLIVRKDKPFDGLEYITSMMPKLSPTQKFITSEDVDPKSGKIRKETWEGIPLSARKDALKSLYNSGDARFKGYIDELRKANPTKDNPNWDGAEFAANYFNQVGQGGKEDAVYYGTGGEFNLGISYGGGKPEIDDKGQYLNNEDTVQLYNGFAGKMEAHTSPYQVSLSTEPMFGKKGSHMQITISDKVINSETGEKEVVGSQALFRPSKVVWLPVVEGQAKKTLGGRLWGDVKSMFTGEKYPPGTILSDKDVASIDSAIMEDPGTSANYIWRPYVVGQMGYERKEGTIGDDERILNLNRSVYVPYEDVSDDLENKFGTKWKGDVGDDINKITTQSNLGNFQQGSTEMDYKLLGL